MRIVKLKDNGDVGETLMGASDMRCRPALGDEYVIAFDAEGIASNGDPIAFRLAFGRDELRRMAAAEAETLATAD